MSDLIHILKRISYILDENCSQQERLCKIADEVSAALRKASPSGYSELVDHYFRCYRDSGYGTAVMGSRNGKAAKELLSLMTLEEAKDAVSAAFADPWYIEHSRELHFIANNLNKYRVPRRPEPKVYHPEPPAPPELTGGPDPELAAALFETLDKARDA